MYKNLESLAILLIKLDNDFVVTTKQVINIDSYYFQLNPMNDKIEVNIVDLKEQSKLKKRNYSFNVNEKPITIGRSIDCNI